MTVDISIVGCGPVGATLANLLADFGHTVAIMEKETEIYHSPRGIHLDDEVIRIFQAVGIIEELQEGISPFKKMQFVSATGKVLMEAGMPDNYQPYGHAPSNYKKKYKKDLSKNRLMKMVFWGNNMLYRGYWRFNQAYKLATDNYY